jgi:haloalkane dehalogenase
MPDHLDAFVTTPVRRVSLDGVELAYRIIGQGPPLLLVHGWPLNGATFRALVAELRDQYTCVVPDLPGAGESPWNARVSELFADSAKLLRRLVDALSLDRFGLVGHDSGGLIARYLAADVGERAAALLLCNTEISHHRSTLVALFQRAAALPGAEAIFAGLLRSRAYRRSALGFGGCFGDLRLLDGEFHRACVEPATTGIAGALAALRSADLRATERLGAVHRAIGAETAFVWGAADRFFPVGAARAMLPEFRHAMGFHEVEGAKLFVHEEAPARVLAAARPLFARTLGGPRAADTAARTRAEATARA